MSGETMSFSCSIPDSIDGKVEISGPYRNYSVKGNPTSFGVDLEFEELNLAKSVNSSDFYLLEGKIEAALRIWEGKYIRHLDALHKNIQSENVDDLNREAKLAIESLENILNDTLAVDDTVDWSTIKRKDSFRIKPGSLFNEGKGPDFIKYNKVGRPIGVEKIEYASEPVFELVKSEYGFFSKLLYPKKIQEDFDNRMRLWRKSKKKDDVANEKKEEILKQVESVFQKKKSIFEQEKEKENALVENLKNRYKEKEAGAIEEYCDLVLNASKYPDYFPQSWILEYRSDNKIVVVEYDLPGPDKIPTVEHYKYVKSRDEITEKKLTQAKVKNLYNDTIYQICIRTIHELFEADAVAALESVAFNGLVTSVNQATGIEETKIIMSVVASKEEFIEYDLAQVDPKATFKHMKGVATVNFVDLIPIPPVIQLDKKDKRFVSGKNIVGNIDDSVNLAAMHWEDFEHLVRELFEKEFSDNGGEVKVTQASSDGGVDAIAFDPDPIRGGKIVIQAKRYTNVVGVAAVRDLYGTVMNEGATKGILVTTSDYGKDSYEFAKDKPITLLTGNNLLSLLEKHGHKARINVSEAKKILNAQL